MAEPRKEKLPGRKCGKPLGGDGTHGNCKTFCSRGWRRCAHHGVREARWLADRIANIMPSDERTIGVPGHFGPAGKAVAELGVDADAEDVLALGYWLILEHPEIF